MASRLYSSDQALHSTLTRRSCGAASTARDSPWYTVSAGMHYTHGGCNDDVPDNSPNGWPCDIVRVPSDLGNTPGEWTAIRTRHAACRHRYQQSYAFTLNYITDSIVGSADHTVFVTSRGARCRVMCCAKLGRPDPVEPKGNTRDKKASTAINFVLGSMLFIRYYLCTYLFTARYFLPSKLQGPRDHSYS